MCEIHVEQLEWCRTSPERIQSLCYAAEIIIVFSLNPKASFSPCGRNRDSKGKMFTKKKLILGDPFVFCLFFLMQCTLYNMQYIHRFNWSNWFLKVMKSKYVLISSEVFYCWDIVVMLPIMRNIPYPKSSYASIIECRSISLNKSYLAFSIVIIIWLKTLLMLIFGWFVIIIHHYYFLDKEDFSICVK